MTYGYWISPKNEVLEVPYESHAEVALELVLKRNPKRFSTYAIMFRLGYVRIVNGRGTTGDSAEYWSRHKLTKLQKEFTRSAKYIEQANDELYPDLYKGLIP